VPRLCFTRCGGPTCWADRYNRSWADQMTLAILEALSQGGTILRRQTTFWDLKSRDSALLRANFVAKAEFKFVEPSFDFAALVADHPVLLDHSEATDALFISTPAPDPDAVLGDLAALVASHFGGWRPLASYLNPGYPPRKILSDGSGMLLRGPRSLVAASTTLLVDRGIRVDEPSRGQALPGHPEALILGRNFIIARTFSFAPAPVGDL